MSQPVSTRITMAPTGLPWLSALLVLLAAVVQLHQERSQSSEGRCTNEEMGEIFSCITPHNQEFFDAIGTGSTCNQTRITSDICKSFGEIVICIMGKNVSNETCLPNAPQQINPQMAIPCKVEDFFALCPNVPNIWDFGTTALPDNNATTPDQPDTANVTTTTTTTSTTTTKGGGGGNNGCERSATQYLWVMSLMMSFLAMLMSTDKF